MTTTRKATTVSSIVKGGSPATSRRQQTAAMGSARSAFVQSANLSKRVSRSGRKATKIAARAEVGTAACRCQRSRANRDESESRSSFRSMRTT